jgi:hypothetical protein
VLTTALLTTTLLAPRPDRHLPAHTSPSADVAVMVFLVLFCSMFEMLISLVSGI